jgi:predicted AlkP superfamily pyrophosphatase or phosphodiesterase
MNRAPQLSIFVLIDALGWQFLQGREFLSDILPYRVPLRTVLGFSSGAIPTILTGLPPSQNGHWNLFYYDPDGSPFRWLRPFRSLPNRVMDHRVTRKLLKEMGRHVLGLGKHFECCVSPRLLPWFNWVEKRNIYDRGGISGAPSIFDTLSDDGIGYRVYSYNQWTDQEILQRSRRDLERREADFFFICLSEMDQFLHDQWKQPEQLGRRLDLYAGSLRQIFELAKAIDENVTIAVFSDHGMTPVSQHFDLVKKVASLGFVMPDDYLSVYDSTMARFWFFRERARRATVECLGALSCGRILPDDELRQLGIFFPDRRYGEVIFLLHPGWLFSRSDFNGLGWMPSGMHGYHPDHPYSYGVFLSNRDPSLPVRTLADVYGCMREAAFRQPWAAGER